MIKNLWNIGLKTSDLDADLDFLKKVGATIVLRDVLPANGDSLEYAIVRLGGVRLLLFPSVIFEDQIPGGSRPASRTRSSMWMSCRPSTHAFRTSAARC
jgi:hypothetical protein